MKLTKESHKLMSFFIKHNCLLPHRQTAKTDTILRQLYEDLKIGVSYVDQLKLKMGSGFYKLNVEHITNVSQIPKPSTFPSNSFPIKIREHIDEHSIGLLTYNFHIFGRNIKIMFLTEEDHVKNIIEKYNNYVDNMLIWLYIADIYSSQKCAKHLKIFIYHTSLIKILPVSNIDILNDNNVNTAFTRTCPINSEIVVFRKEEWFKVFIHETFHNFGLDFSDMNQAIPVKKILSIFPVNSDVNLYEAYTEFWARIINAMFCSFINIKDKNDIDDFLTNAEFFINLERIFAFYQTIKVLDFMGISYGDLYKKTNVSENMRKTFYKEDTSVLSYFVITLILLNNYQDFISWCNTNNILLLNFKKTDKNLDEFCKFIEKKYKMKNMLDDVECSEKLLRRTKRLTLKQKDTQYLLKNLRMTLCELG